MQPNLLMLVFDFCVLFVYFHRVMWGQDWVVVISAEIVSLVYAVYKITINVGR